MSSNVALVGFTGALKEQCFCRREIWQQQFYNIIINEVLLLAADKLVLFDRLPRKTVV